MHNWYMHPVHVISLSLLSKRSDMYLLVEDR